MIRVCRERNNQRGVDFWSYVLSVTNILVHDGMSDEENAEVPVRYGDDGSLIRQQVVRKIPVLWWRHPWFEDLFKAVDSATGVERVIFHRAGKLTRLRVPEVSYRPPPRGLPVSFFRQEYLDALLPVDRDELMMSDEQIPVYNFVDYDPNRDSESTQASASGSRS